MNIKCRVHSALLRRLTISPSTYRSKLAKKGRTLTSDMSRSNQPLVLHTLFHDVVNWSPIDYIDEHVAFFLKDNTVIYGEFVYVFKARRYG